VTTTLDQPGPPAARPARFRPDWFDAGVLVALGALACFTTAVLLWRSRGPLVWTGTDGPYLGDQMQYLGWIRDSADHGLIGNPFVLEDRAHSFAHPGLLLSGLLARLGVPAAAAYLLWKPVAVVALFVAARAFVRHHTTSVATRRAALVLALLALSPVPALVTWLDLAVGPADRIRLQAIAFDLWPSLYLWGYPFTALAVAAMVGSLLTYERDRTAGRATPLPAALGLSSAWLQPWQGATVLAVVVGTEALLWARDRVGPPVRLLVSTVAATVAPLTYYAVLAALDPTWERAGEANRHDPWPIWPLVAVLAPLLAVAVPAFRRRVDGFGTVALRLWPLAALAVYAAITYLPVGTFPLHSVQGLSVPLAVLAAMGAASITWPAQPAARIALAGLAVAAFAVPGTVRQLADTRTGLTAGASPYLISRHELAALQAIEDAPGDGGVLATVRLGQTVPGLTGRRTWVGIASWTPDFPTRVQRAAALFAGDLEPDGARTFVRSTGARFVLADCETPTDLDATLAPLDPAVQRFGCATVYDLGPR
jgi:hypothetical protein